ncbi:MAG: class I SAM-dependent methyltransferase [Rubrobacter sp.]
MDEYGSETYGDKIAGVYDEWFNAPEGTEITVGFLRELGDSGPVLELGIGTGRIALPLVRKGIEVHGIDASEAMVEKLRSKPGGESIPVTLGDFAEVGVERRFSLVYVVFNTFFALLTQEEQVSCFANVARRLEAGGTFVIEAFVPDLSRFTFGQTTQTRHVGPDEVVIEYSRHDPVRQRVDAQNVIMREDGDHLYPVSLRYAWPSELDLMARLAGLTLRERYGGWNRQPFIQASETHVSVYEKTEPETPTR